MKRSLAIAADLCLVGLAGCVFLTGRPWFWWAVAALSTAWFVIAETWRRTPAI